ncbi:unnamed protein product [Adineta steineri]|uniref:Acetylserotonin O-methyltransferase n=1 Tax=Adineta steineri TaxID=433720 RepID=A0A813Y1W2_9BILA|nr:unnamed protein product [Adineta steineri]CAF4018958.1 unnamed protein product [Adineta steineri]
MPEQHTTGFGKYMSFITNRLLENIVWTFTELGIANIFAAVDKPQTAEELAKKQGWNSEYLYRLLRTVTDADIVREIKSDQTIEPEKTNRFELTEHGTGVQYVIGNQSTFDFIQKKEDKKIGSGFNEAMTCISKNYSQSLINTIDFSRFNKIVDIGGGLGLLLSQILKKYGTIPQADVYIIKNIIHDWNDNRAIDIFKAIRKAANEQ